MPVEAAPPLALTPSRVRHRSVAQRAQGARDFVGLPDLVEVCLSSRSKAPIHVHVPGSKSITNRALILAAISSGKTVLQSALWSEDTEVMTKCLQDLGFKIQVAKDPLEPCNRTITVFGLNGKIPRAGTEDAPLDLFVGNAGTAARFLAVLVCLGNGYYRLHGIDRMHQRPFGALLDALRELGYQIHAPGNKLPAVVCGAGPRLGNCTVQIAESSQFASALLLCASVGKWTISIEGEDPEESPYVAMTSRLLEKFPKNGGVFQIEPDASSASYFWAAAYLLNSSLKSKDTVTVENWPESGWQIDAAFPKYLPLPKVLSRKRDLADSIMTAIVLAPFASHPVKFKDLGRLRVQECERVQALRRELTKCGADIREKGDTLTVYPSTLHGAEIETYKDHRMAMCFAVLGLKVPGIRIKNPSCVRKTFPDFFAKLASAMPMGLGVRVVDAATGQVLSGSRLLAS